MDNIGEFPVREGTWSQASPAESETTVRTETLVAVVELASMQFPDMLSGIVMLDASGTVFESIFCPQAPAALTNEITGMTVGRNTSACGLALSEKKNVFIVDAAVDPRSANFRYKLVAFGVRACWSIPLYARDKRALGTFVFFCSVPKKPSDNDIRWLTALSTIASDAIERDKAQAALIRTQSLVRATYMASPAGIAISTTSGQILMANPSYCQMLGYSEPELQAMNFADIASREDSEAVMKGIARLLSGKCEHFSIEKRYIAKSTAIVWTRSSIAVIRAEDGSPTNLITVSEDITRPRQARESLLQAQSLLQIASRVAHIGGWSYSLAEKKLIWSEAIAAIHEEASETVPTVEQALLRYVPEYRGRIHDAFHLCVAHGTNYDEEAEIVTATGRRIWVRAIGEAIRDDSGTITAVQGALQDISERKRAASEREQSMQRLQRISDRLSILIFEFHTRPDGTTVMPFASEYIEELFQISAVQAAIDAKPVFEQIHLADRAAFDSAVEKSARSLSPLVHELRITGVAGKIAWVRLDAHPCRASDGTMIWHGFMADVTEHKKAELDLRRLNRALQMRSALSKSIIHSESEEMLLSSACQIAIDIGGYMSSSIGYALDDDYSTILPVTCLGAATDYFSAITLSWSDDVMEGWGPSGRAVRTGQPVVCEDLSIDSLPAEMSSKALALGLRAVVVLPLHDKSATFGVLILFLSEVRHISTEEVNLLQSLADDLAFGITHHRAQMEQRQLQRAITTIASSVSGEKDAFFEHLARNMASSVNADAACIAHLIPGKPGMARTLGGVVDGAFLSNFEYAVMDAPCRHLQQEDECILTGDLAIAFPNCEALQGFGAQAYIGRTLFSPSGRRIGMIFLIFRSRLKNTDFVVSALKVFTSRAAAELQRLESDVRIREQASLLDKAQDAIIVRGLDHTVRYWNESAHRMYGWSAEEVLNRPLNQNIYRNPQDYHRATTLLLQRGEWHGELNQITKDGRSIYVEARWTLVLDDDGQPDSILAINTDITSQKTAAEEIVKLAFYDPLTELPNRRLLVDRLRQAIVEYGTQGFISAVLFIDLDNFKSLNDTMGHDIGDQLLQQVAIRLQSCFREVDTIARLGGDEFVVVATRLSSQLEEAIRQTNVMAGKILAVLNTPYQLAEQDHFSTPSIGIALINHSDATTEEMLKQADLAMYQAKNAGRNTFRFFDDTMQSIVLERVALEADLRQALHYHQFYLVYQPQVDHQGRVTGAEALLRWLHPQRGLVSPAHFIPLAEESRLISPIGQWILQTACAQLAAWQRHSATDSLTLAINVSACQFRQPNFVCEVLDALTVSGANPARLKIELTESLLVDNVEEIIEKMTALKAHGICFSLDDFGTGYSSLSYLKRLPLDQLKIDQSFVRDVLTDPNDASIARTIVDLGRSLGLNVIAEGVETDEQKTFLAENGCLAYQGYLFSKPLPIQEFDQYVQRLLEKDQITNN